VISTNYDRATRRDGFRAHSLEVRYPRLLARTVAGSVDSTKSREIDALQDFVAGRTRLRIPPMISDPVWSDIYARHEGVHASDIDFLDLEYLVFHQILLAHRYWDDHTDPFAADKHIDFKHVLPAYAQTFDRLDDLQSALSASLMGNAHDASQLTIKTDGHMLAFDALPATVALGGVDIVCDNAGHEFLSDLLLAAYLLKNWPGVVRLHVKPMPWFVSDATIADAEASLNALAVSPAADQAFGRTLLDARKVGRLKFLTHPHWTRPVNFGEGHLIEALGHDDGLVIVKGDLNYRRCLADISTDIFTPWDELPHLPDVPVLSLRSVKSHCWAGVPRDQWPSGLADAHFPMDGSIFCTQHIPARWAKSHRQN
jgi:hypothetical protein